MSKPERFAAAPHPIVARVQTSKSQPGRAGGWQYGPKEPLTDDERKLLRDAADRSETYLTRTLGDASAKPRGELVAEIAQLRAQLEAQARINLALNARVAELGG